MKKYLLLIISICACITNSALSMELPTYLPHTASSYVIATLITSAYYASRWYSTPSLFDVTPNTIGLLTCIPTQSNANQTEKGIPWYTLVESMQQDMIPQKALMQVESNDDITINLEQGITANPEHETVFLFSRGFATRGGLIKGTPLADRYQDIVNKGGGLMAGHMAIKDNLVTNAPCYSFDYPDTPRYLNLGQSKDVHYLKTAWNEISDKNPQANIVGIGDCRGSKALLEFATEQPNNLKALVLMAPFISLHELTRHIASNYLYFPYSDKILHACIKYFLPSINTEEDDLANRLSSINPTIPIFIAHRMGDSVISYHDIQLLVNRMQNNGNKDVYLLEIKDDTASHSRLSHITEFQQALNAFYAHYNLPHNKTLAQEGAELLKKIKCQSQPK